MVGPAHQVMEIPEPRSAVNLPLRTAGEPEYGGLDLRCRRRLCDNCRFACCLWQISFIAGGGGLGCASLGYEGIVKIFGLWI